MEFDIKVGMMTWEKSARLAKEMEAAGVAGMLVTETGQTPWQQLTAAAMATSSLELSTGIAVAFPRSPMITAQTAWEFSANTKGRFRLGLGSQVRGHVVRRYSSNYDKPAPQMRDYVMAVKACLRAFRGEEKLQHEGPYYQLSYLPRQWAPLRHDYEDVKIDVSAVGPYMCRMVGELCDGLHVHPVHSVPYIQNRLLPDMAKGAEKAGRSVSDVDLLVPVYTVAGDTEEEQAFLKNRARSQVAFYGSTPNYAHQFDDLGYEGLTPKLGGLIKAGDTPGMAELITDEILDHFAVVAKWDDMADKLIERYQGIASRIITYLAEEDLERNPQNLPRWGEIAKAVRAA